MTERKIVIKTCEECPHIGREGVFCRIAYIPRCANAKKNLPHEVVVSKQGFVSAKPTYEIPDWCPLEENKKCQ